MVRPSRQIQIQIPSDAQVNEQLASHVIASDNEGKNLRSVKK